MSAPDAAADARALVDAARVATLATVGEDGAPWASVVAVAALPDGAPVLCVSTLAEHGRNLARDGRCSLAVLADEVPDDPLEASRVTLAGVARATGDPTVRAAFLARHPAAATYVDFADFATYVVTVAEVRWVGGYGRMATVDPAAYRR